MTKQPEELALLAESGRLLASVFALLDRTPLAGLSTLQVDDMVERFIVRDLPGPAREQGPVWLSFCVEFLGERCGLPRHSIAIERASGRRHRQFRHHAREERLYRGFQQNLSRWRRSIQPRRRLVQTTYEAMWMGIRAVRPGARLGDIGWAIERHAKRNGYSVVREYCGHGIGREMHEEPQVLHFGKPGTGLALREGMVFTIEPMLNRGRRSVRTEPDGWTVVTRDGSLSAQFEHTVAVTASGVSVLTLRPDEPGSGPV